ncbi:MAG: filamentous hemagglutinin N-terminal domain-containing protein [Xenococcus sp. (in: cyanobacteria)]
MRNINKLNFGFWLITAQLAAMGSSALAQITPDTTLPNNSAVTRNGEEITIDQGTANGNNLFHSFSEFNVNNGETAIFSNGATIDNIITRVTGGQFSNIDGVIKANGTANLFLLNPSGIKFGPNAELKIGGSFVGSTAESFVFEDGSIYSATNPTAPPLLTVNVPLGLQYGSNPHPIQVQEANLQVQSGQTLTLAGGDLDIIGGTLQAPNGRISLASATAAGGDLDVVGGTLQAPNGRISLASATAGTLTLDESLGIARFPDTNDGGNINLSQQSLVEVTGASDGIDLTTGNLTLTEGSRLQTITEVPGKAGDITLNASETITIDGFSNDGLSSGVLSRSVGENGGNGGIGGNITINQTDNPQGDLTLSNRGFIAAVTNSNNNSGDIEVNVNNLKLLSGGQIISATRGNGTSGKMTVNVTEELLISGSNSTFRFQKVNIHDLNQLDFNTEADPNIENSETIPHVSVERTATEIKSSSTILGTAEDGVGVFDFFSFSVTEANSQGTFDIDGGESDDGYIDTKIFLFNFATGELLKKNNDDPRFEDGGKDQGSEFDLTYDSFIDTVFSKPGTYVIAVGNKESRVFPFNSTLTENPLDKGDTYTLQVSLENQGTLTDNNALFNTDNFNPNIGINSGLFSVTFDAGNGGDVSVNVGTLTDVNNTVLSNIAQNDGQLKIMDGGQLRAEVLTNATGSGGNVTIETAKLLVTDGGVISTSVLAENAEVQGGDLTLRATESIEISDSIVQTLLRSDNPQANGGNLTVETPQLTVKDGAQLGSGSNLAGDGGDVTIQATESAEFIGISSADSPLVEAELIQAGEPTIIYSDTFGSGNAGKFIIETPRLIVRDGAQVSVGTFGSGNGADLEVNASDSIEISGAVPILSTARSNNFPNIDDPNNDEGRLFPSGLYAASTDQGNAGNITLQTEQLIIRDNAQVSVSSQQETEKATGGNITIDSNSLELDNSKITAESAFGGGGVITLNLDDQLLLRNNSNISATAGIEESGGEGRNINEQSQGDGGNINITTSFIIAPPFENSDITANAFQGKGGNINITANGIFGLKFREDETTLSDITASSEFGLEGTVAINNPDVDPTSAIVELPAQVTDPSDKVIAGCAAASGNSFTITGQGGLPEDPNNTTIYGQTILSDLRDFTASDSKEDLPTVKKQARQQLPRSIVQVNSWIVNQDGEVELVAALPQESSFLKHPNCQDLER